MTAFAQLEVKEGSFKEVQGFVNINPDQNYQTDDNDLPFAVIKVRTENINDKQRRELKFSGNAGTFIVLEYKDGEVWVYLTAKYAEYLKISHHDLSSIEFTLPYDLEPKKGYEMTLVNKSVDEDIQKKLARLEELENAVDIAQKTSIIKKVKLSGKFSVSPDKQVFISTGNLQYQASTKTWRFAENQWDVIGADNKNCSQNYSGWIDLFKWGTSGYNGKDPYMKSRRDKDYGDGKNDIAGTNYDWGVYNTISNGGDNKWRTLTLEEYLYLYRRKDESSGQRLIYRAIVNDVKGIIILPDDWNMNYYKFKVPSKDGAWGNFNDNVISIYDWINIFEKNGAVFLPNAGIMNPGILVGYQSVFYGYWTSTHYHKKKACTMPIMAPNRAFALPVRLVSDVE